jgi:hypothetical protein
VLPGVVERDNGDEAATAVEAPEAPTEDELEKLAAAKADADAAAGRFGELKTALIDREVEAWGKAVFADALLLADTADKAAESAQYGTALRSRPGARLSGPWRLWTPVHGSCWTRP